jgi:hypothetical protein
LQKNQPGIYKSSVHNNSKQPMEQQGSSQQGSSQANTSEIHQQTTSDLQQLEEPQPGSASSGNSSSNGSSSSWRQRLIRYSIKVIQAVLLIEIAAIVVQPLLPAPSKSKEATDSDEQGIDPADVLMDYFTGRRGGRMQHGLLFAATAYLVILANDKRVACS